MPQVSRLLLRIGVEANRFLGPAAVLHVHRHRHPGVSRSGSQFLELRPGEVVVHPHPQLGELDRDVGVDLLLGYLLDAIEVDPLRAPARRWVADLFTEVIQRCLHPQLVELAGSPQPLCQRVPGNEAMRQRQTG